MKPVVVRTIGGGGGSGGGEKRDEKESNSSDCLSAVLGGKPLLCLEFGDMRMRVEQPRPALVGGKKQKASSSSSSRGGALLA